MAMSQSVMSIVTGTRLESLSETIIDVISALERGWQAVVLGMMVAIIVVFNVPIPW